MNNKEEILKLVNEKVENLKQFIRQHSRNDVNLVNMILSMVNSDEYLTIADQYLLQMKKNGESFKSLVDGMISNFNIHETKEVRLKLERYLLFFCNMSEKLRKL